LAESIPEWRANLQAGTVFARYRLVEQIAASGTAVVWRAADDQSRRPVALKVLAPERLPDPDSRQRFILGLLRAEATVPRSRIVPVYLADEASGLFFVAMELLSGGDLRDLLRREGTLSPRRTLRLIEPVGAALDALHAAGLVHGDVKPANMLLDPYGDVHLSDFGFGPSITALAAPELTQVTVDYLAPEQILSGAVTGSADQYALACVTYQALTGRAPFRRESLDAILWAQVNEPPPSLATRWLDLPTAADGVLAKAMAKDPRERYRSCAEFVQALDEALTGPAPVVAASGGPLDGGAADWGSIDDIMYLRERHPRAAPAPADQSATSALPPVPVPRLVDDDVRFTVYRPDVLAPEQWASMLVFAHKTSPVEQAGRPPLDPLRVVADRASVLFGDHPPAPVSADARNELPRGVQLRIVPYLPGLQCNPPEATLDWWEPVHEAAFRVRAGAHLNGTFVRGAIRIWCGPLIFGEADVFQLFWSRYSMRSLHCRQEWEHALALGRPSFVRPLYWEDPLPEDSGQGLPPAALRALHFVHVPVQRTPTVKEQTAARERRQGPTPALSAPESWGPPPAGPAPWDAAPSAGSASPPAYQPVQASTPPRPPGYSPVQGGYAPRQGNYPPLPGNQPAAGPGGSRPAAGGPRGKRRRRRSPVTVAALLIAAVVAVLVTLYLAGIL
jgi:serine/threonine protein kinase